MSHIHRTLLLASSAMMIAGAAHAQDAANAGSTLEEIVVTAQRRAENLQDVPIAVNAITAATAEKLGISDPISLSQAIPGLNLGRQGNSNTPFIRGIGTGAGITGNEPSVATFIDDVYMPVTAGSSFAFNNIQSVEVLKGPQGTLFGRNATGGVMHIRTKNPTHTPAADISATYGNYDTKKLALYGTAGLTDTIAANIAGYVNDQGNGWGTNITTGADTFKTQSYGIRTKVLAEPTDKDSMLFSYAYDNAYTNQGIALRSAPNALSFGGYSADRNGAGFYDGTANADAQYHNYMHSGSLKVRHEFDNATLVSITAYNHFHTRSQIDTDTTPTNLVKSDYTQQEKTLTQEFQLLSRSDAPVQWILGTFYLSDKANFLGDFTGSAFGANHQYLTATQQTESYSGFAQATAEILPKTRMTIGVRYTSDARKYFGIVDLAPSRGATPALRSGPFTSKKTFSELTGRFALDYKVTDDVMVYAAYNRGFKSGVYNLAAQGPTTPFPGPAAVEPEDLNAYSAGFKSEFFDRRLRVNAEGWYYDYKNIQVVNQQVGGQVLTNAGAAHIKGVDFDVTMVPVSNLTLTAAVSLADGHYTKFPAGPTFYGTQLIAGDPNSCTMVQQGVPSTAHAQLACNLKGKKTVQTIPLSVNVSASYRIPTSAGPFDLTAGWSHGGDFYWEADNDRDSHQKKTDVFNASIQWSTPDEAYSVRVFGNNLGQEKYYAYGANSATANFKYSPAPPRTYGVTVSAHY